MINLILFVTFFIFLLLNTPIAVSLGMSSILAMIYAGDKMSVIPTNLFSGMAKFLLLAIPFFVLSGNVMAESMEKWLVPNLKEAGIRLTLVPMEMKDLLRAYNDKDVEDIDMFYLADDFNIEFDPQLFFLAGDPEAPEEDTLAWVHAQMAEYARLMCETEPSDALGFVQKWITFQEQLSEMLPLLPVYSNVYYDFYTSDLMNYDIIRYITWGDAIVASSYYNVYQSMVDRGIDPVIMDDELLP